MIEVDKVSQLYATRNGEASWALKDVSLAVERAEFICLIGPSGCGKTTLLHLIAGFIQPTYGEIRMHGRRVRAASPDRGVVFQEYALFAWMTARQNIEFGLRMRGVGRKDRRDRAMAALVRVNLERAADKYPHELSGGMRQRIAVARALVNEPDILLMDEPFAAVDAITRSSLQQDLVRLWQETGVSIVFVTHNIDEAVCLAGRVVVMGAHPGTVRHDMIIQASYPRSRDSREFGKLFTEIAEALEGREMSG